MAKAAATKKPMTKSELLTAIAEDCELTRRQVSDDHDCVLDGPSKAGIPAQVLTKLTNDLLGVTQGQRPAMIGTS